MANKEFFENHTFFEGLKQGVDEALEYAKGDKTKARVRILTAVDPVSVSPYKAMDIAQLRRTLNMSQKGFALAIGVSPRTVESWEAGKSLPSGIANRMLFLLEKDNSLLDKLVKR